MLNKIFTQKHSLIWLLFHVALGVISTRVNFILIIWFFIILIELLYCLFKSKKDSFSFIGGLVYLVSFEILARMSNASPFIPYEMGKYVFLLFLLARLIVEGKRANKGALIVILMLPSLFIDFSGEVVASDWLFNLCGLFNIGLSIWYFTDKKCLSIELVTLLRLIILPLVSALSFAIIKTPEYSEIEFDLGANFDTTGGFGSNQVSTIFGLGFFIIFVSIYKKLNMFRNIYIEYLIFLIFFFQGIISFSRGGVYGGLLAIFLVYVIDLFKKNHSRSRLFFRGSLSILFLILLFVAANNITGGNLLLRYQGETAGTLNGTRDKDLNTLTSNRADIFEGDIDLFKNNIILGVGGGASKYIRTTQKNVLTHVELSRTLAEHGLLGLIIVILLFYLVYNVVVRNLHLDYGGILIAFAVLSLYTTFHAATRTFVSPLLIGISVMILQEKRLVFKNGK